MAVQPTLRPATPDDAEFLYRVIERTMRGYVEQTWGRFDEYVNRKNIAGALPAGRWQIVRAEGDIGVLSVERRSGDIWLGQLFILPEHQNRGIGSHFVRLLKEEAAAARQPLRLRVLAVNPARRLYEREGFRLFCTTPGRNYMQWLPPGLDFPSGAGDCPPALRSTLDACGIAPDAIAERYLVVQPEASRLELVAKEDSGREHRLAPDAARAWGAMRNAAAAHAVALFPVSAFRSIERQAEIIRAKLAAGQAIESILKVSAPPGYSEHHTGRAIDLGTDGAPPLDTSFEGTQAFAWLSANAASFGFSLSYPRGNPYNYEYEPWHWFYRET